MALRSTIRVGLIGSLVAWHLCLVGMVETFAERRLIGQTLTLGYILLFGVVLVMGYFAARTASGPGPVLLAGGLVGGMVGLSLSLLAGLTATLNLRTMFIYASPSLVEILTLEQGVGTALLFPVVGGLLAGLLGAGLILLPPTLRRVVTVALIGTVMIGLLRDVVVALLPRNIARTLFTSSGLTPTMAMASLIGLGLLSWLLSLANQSKVLAQRTVVLGRRRVDLRETLGLFLLGLFLLSFPLWSNLFLSNVAAFIGLYIIMGLGLNLVVGFAGLLDLGYAGFYAVGAYTMAVLTSPDLGFYNLTFWEALPLAMLAAMFAGLLLGLPVLRMRGDYLAITTLGFGEIIRLLALSEFLKPYLGGAQGVTRIDYPTIGNFVIDTPQEFYYLILVGCLITWFIAVRLKSSRLGRAWMAIREDEDVAQAMGINRVTAKLTAFALGALLGGMSGAMFASLVNSVVPRSFELIVSINVLALIIVGGMGSLPGVLVGALVLVGLPELLREFREYRFLVYGAVLVVMMLYRPEGLWPEAAVARELHETEEEPVTAEVPAAVPQATPPRKTTEG